MYRRTQKEGQGGSYPAGVFAVLEKKKNTTHKETATTKRGNTVKDKNSLVNVVPKYATTCRS